MGQRSVILHAFLASLVPIADAVGVAPAGLKSPDFYRSRRFRMTNSTPLGASIHDSAVVDDQSRKSRGICAITRDVIRSETKNKCLGAHYISEDAHQETTSTRGLPSSLFTACTLRHSLRLTAGECDSLAAGSSSRSAAPFFRTHDRKFVLKVIKDSEVVTLEHLSETTYKQHIQEGYRQHIQEGNTLMVPFIYFIKEKNLVVMPSMFSDMEELLRKLYGDEHTQKIDKYDVKPAQVPHSDERAPWFAHLARLYNKTGGSLKKDDTLVCGSHTDRRIRCWEQLEKYAKKDVDFLASVERKGLGGRALEFIDYSMVFLVTESPGVVETSSVDVPKSCVISTKGGSTSVICVKMIDYLMEKTLLRELESLTKNGKFFQYGEAIKLLVRCSGNVDDIGCKAYQKIAKEAIGDGA